MCTHLLAQVSQWSLRHFTKINLAWPKGHDTIRCLALGAEVPEYCPGQILQTLIVRLLKRLWVSVNQNFSNVPPTLPPFSTPWAKSSWSILRVENPQCSLRGQLSRHTHFTHDCSIITTTTPTFCYCSHKQKRTDWSLHRKSNFFWHVISYLWDRYFVKKSRLPFTSCREIRKNASIQLYTFSTYSFENTEKLCQYWAFLSYSKCILG